MVYGKKLAWCLIIASNIMYKPRNWVAKQCRDLSSPFRPTVERDRSKYTRKQKHKERYA